ncbi:hypothetical protein I317_03109 [Kwoniella heveanensis CBS 569]|nr:hypothetical protein I317_03109 [Kwoniella heveanensis CBS 569]
MQNERAAAKPPPVYPHAWREIISGSIEENFASIAQGTLNNLITPDFVPPPEHIQFLLYLVLNPSTCNAATPEQPLALLSRLLSTHAPSSFAHNIPYHPSTASHDLRKSNDVDPPYLDWDYRRSELHKAVWRCMRKCKDGAVWELLWIEDSMKRSADRCERKRKRTSRVVQDEEDDDDEEGKDGKVVSEGGCDLLEWLVDMWEVDRSLQQDLPYSPVFLKQIPRPYGDLQRNDAAAILSIVKCAYSPMSSSIHPELLDTVQRPLSSDIRSKTQSQTPFHPASLASSLVHLFRSLPTQSLLDLVRSVREIEDRAKPGWITERERGAGGDRRAVRKDRDSSRALAHIITLCIEDLVGIRASKNAQRRELATSLKQRQQRQQRSHIIQGNESDKTHSLEQGDFINPGYLDLPTINYLYRGILPLCLPAPDSPSSRDNAPFLETLKRLIQLKLALLSICIPPRTRARPLSPTETKVKTNGSPAHQSGEQTSQQEAEHTLLGLGGSGNDEGYGGCDDDQANTGVGVGRYTMDKKEYDDLQCQLADDHEWWTEIERSVSLTLDPVDGQPDDAINERDEAQEKEGNKNDEEGGVRQMQLDLLVELLKRSIKASLSF